MVGGTIYNIAEVAELVDPPSLIGFGGQSALD